MSEQTKPSFMTKVTEFLSKYWYIVGIAIAVAAYFLLGKGKKGGKGWK